MTSGTAFLVLRGEGGARNVDTWGPSGLFRWNGIRIPAQSELAGISLRLSDSKSHALVCVSPDLVFSPESRRQRLRDHAALPEGVGHRVRVSLRRW